MDDAADILSGMTERTLSALSAAIGSGAEKFKQTLRAKTPLNRKKTRRHTVAIHRAGELNAVAGVIFPSGSRYDTDGTKTREIVQGAYRSDAQKILDHMANQLSQAIEQQPIKTIEIRKG